MNEILLRVRDYYTYKGMSARAFAIAIGFSYSTFNYYMLGKRSIIDARLFTCIVSTFDDISAEWLMRGEGNMIKGGKDNASADRISKLVDTIAFQQGTITEQSTKISEYESRIKAMETELSKLRHQKNII